MVRCVEKKSARAEKKAECTMSNKWMMLLLKIETHQSKGNAYVSSYHFILYIYIISVLKSSEAIESNQISHVDDTFSMQIPWPKFRIGQPTFSTFMLTYVRCALFFFYMSQPIVLLKLNPIFFPVALCICASHTWIYNISNTQQSHMFLPY